MRLLVVLIALTGAMAACTDPVAGGRTRDTTGRILAAHSPSAGRPAQSCAAAGGFFIGTAVSGREGWYGQHLRAMHETPLCAEEGAPAEVYRLTWIPSFHPT